MGSFQQALLMDDPDGGVMPPGPPTCVADQYYSCGPDGDPYWDYVVLMLHFDGNFTDSSTSAKTATVANVTTTADASKYGSGGAQSSAGGQVLYATSADFEQGTGIPFTIEFWINIGSAVSGYFMAKDASRYFVLSAGVLSSPGYTFGTLTPDTWYHVAISYTGSFGYGSLNGIVTSTQPGAVVSLATAPFDIFGVPARPDLTPLVAKIDDVRYTQGVARYTGNFNIPTEAFPDYLATSTTYDLLFDQTSILLHLNDSFEDSSNYAHVPTVTGGAVCDGTLPKFGLGSAIFDGVDNYVTYPNNPAFLFGSGDFTVECWAYVTGTLPTAGDYQGICGVRTTVSSNFSWVLLINGDQGGRFQFITSQTGTGDGVSVLSNDPVTLSQWHHIAVVRSGDYLNLYLNGVLQSSPGNMAGLTLASSSAALHIGRMSGGIGSYWFSGYIDELRITKGARYTGNFSVQTAEFPEGQPRTVLLSHAEDTTDYSCYQEKTITLTGTAAVSSAEYKFGTNSFAIANTGASTLNGVAITDHQDFDFGVNDFTIEMWAYRASQTYAGTLFSFIVGNTFSLTVAATTGLVSLNYSSSGGWQSSISGASVFPVGEWQHVVVQRRGTNFEFYLHGYLRNITAITGGAASTVNVAGDFYLGRSNVSTTTTWNGYIDEVRITKGVARYLPDFTAVDANSSDPLWDETIFLMNGEDGLLSDSSQYSLDCTSSTGVALSTTQKVFGANSYYISALGQYLSGPGDVALIGQLGSDEFCIDFWIYPISNDVNNDGTLFWIGSINAKWKTDGSVRIGYVVGGSSTAELAPAGSAPANQWTHVAFGRKNETGTSPYFYLAINGEFVVWRQSASAGAIGTSGFNSFGFLNSGNATIYYLDNFRVTLGVPRFLDSFDTETLPWCESTTSGEVRTVEGSSPLTGIGIEIQQQSIGSNDANVKLNSLVIRSNGDGQPPTYLVTRLDTYAGTLTASSLNQNRTQALTGAAIATSRGSLSVPSYPTLYNRTFTGMTNTAAFPARVRLTLFSNGTILVRDQNLNTLASSTWIDTTQTNYVISDIANLYRVTSVVYLAGASYTTATAVPAALSSAFIVTAENGVLFSAIVGFDFQLTIAPTTSNPRYGEPGYSATIRCSGSLETGA